MGEREKKEDKWRRGGCHPSLGRAWQLETRRRALRWQAGSTAGATQVQRARGTGPGRAACLGVSGGARGVHQSAAVVGRRLHCTAPGGPAGPMGSVRCGAPAPPNGLGAMQCAPPPPTHTHTHRLGAMRCAHPPNQPHTQTHTHTTTTIHVPPAGRVRARRPAHLARWGAPCPEPQTHQTSRQQSHSRRPPAKKQWQRQQAGWRTGEPHSQAPRCPGRSATNSQASSSELYETAWSRCSSHGDTGKAAVCAQPQRGQQGGVSSVGSGPQACLGSLGVGLAPIHDRLDLVSHARQHLGQHCQFVPGRKHSSRLCEGWGAVAESTKA